MAIGPNDIKNMWVRKIVDNLEKGFDNALTTCILDSITNSFNGAPGYKISSPCYVHKSIVNEILLEVKNLYENAGWENVDVKYDEGFVVLYLDRLAYAGFK